MRRIIRETSFLNIQKALKCEPFRENILKRQFKIHNSKLIFTFPFRTFSASIIFHPVSMISSSESLISFVFALISKDSFLNGRKF